jgi:DNA-binding NarL/FixJ family response regulator
LEQAETIIRTLIVDDHPVVRYGVKHILDSEPDIEVVGELDGIDGIETTLDRLYPHVVLLDLEMGDIQGAEALRQLRDVAPNVHVIVYTSHDEEEYIIRAAELGVNGYLLKGSPKEEIVSAVRCVNEGGTAIESAVAAKLMQHMNKRSTNARQPKQVLKLLAAGKTNSNIGTALFISESTVKFHVHSILSKMGATNRTEAVSIATRQGVITLNADD